MDLLIRDLKGLPLAVVSGLQRLRELDTLCKELSDIAKDSEDQLLAQLSMADKEAKAGGKPINEEEYQARLYACNDYRSEISVFIDQKVQLAKSLYELLDDKIQYIDKHSRSIKHLLQEAQDESTYRLKKKKKKSKNTEQQNNEDVIKVGDTLYVADPNEPVYCICQRVSFGEMIGCENEECKYSWFHLSCMGLSEAPKDAWFCPDCTARLSL